VAGPLGPHNRNVKRAAVAPRRRLHETCDDIKQGIAATIQQSVLTDFRWVSPGIDSRAGLMADRFEIDMPAQTSVSREN
jgi:hypothetical protein